MFINKRNVYIYIYVYIYIHIYTYTFIYRMNIYIEQKILTVEDLR